jgi:hypothetical protein
MRIQTACFSFFLLLIFSRTGYANELLLKSLQDQIATLQTTVNSLQATVQTQNQLIEMQGAKIQFLESRVEKIQTPVSTTGGPSTLPPPPPPRGLANWNPEIGVIGDVVSHLTEDSEDSEGNDSIVMRELELIFGQYVDPYSRFDAAVVLNDALEEQNAEIEQAYYTRWGLPFDFKAVIGKFRPMIGKANLKDRHALDTVDEPFVITNFFGEEGWSTSGARLQNYLPNPWNIPLQITGEVLNNSGSPSFSGVRRRPVFNLHTSAFFDLSDTRSLEIGGTSLFGTDSQTGGVKGNDRYNVHIFGFDATYLDLMDGIKRFKLQSELYFQARKFQSLGEEFGNISRHPWGFYALADYKFAQQFSGGIRFDYLKPLGSTTLEDGTVTEFVNFGSDYSWAVSPYLTFWQSEFAHFRLQYQHSEIAGGKSDDAILLQATFQIGTDRHGL